MNKPDRTPAIVDHIMRGVPATSYRYCKPGELGCACIGCVNRLVSEQEWEAWKKRHNFCESCGRYERESDKA